MHPTRLIGVRVVAPHFVAGLELDQGVVVRAAPILKRLRGLRGRDVLALCKRNGWDARRLRDLP